MTYESLQLRVECLTTRGDIKVPKTATGDFVLKLNTTNRVSNNFQVYTSRRTTAWSKIPLEKLTVAKTVDRFPPFVEPNGSWPHSHTWPGTKRPFQQPIGPPPPTTAPGCLSSGFSG